MAVGVIFVLGLVFYISVKQEERLKKNESKFHEINVDQYNELLYGDKKFVLVLGRPGCSHCVAYKPVITSFANNYGVDVYYLNVDNIQTEEDWDEIWGLVEQEGTPTTAVIENREKIVSEAGELSVIELTEMFTKAGVLSGD